MISQMITSNNNNNNNINNNNIFNNIINNNNNIKQIIISQHPLCRCVVRSGKNTLSRKFYDVILFSSGPCGMTM